MKRVIYNCDRCGNKIKNKVHKISGYMINQETGELESNDDFQCKNLDFCSACMLRISSDMYRQYGGEPIEDDMDEVAERVEEKLEKLDEKKRRSHSREKIDLDMDKVLKLKAGGYTNSAIGAVFGVSPQTVARRIQETEREEEQLA